MKWLKLTDTYGDPVVVGFGEGGVINVGTYENTTWLQGSGSYEYNGVKETPEEIFEMLKKE